MQPLRNLALAAALAFAPANAPPPAPADPITWTVAEDGVAAQYYPVSHPRGAAVLLLVGSEGGYAPPELAHALVAEGHPVLALAYFSGIGPQLHDIPARLEAVPLEYFDRALDRLRRVSHRPLAVVGESRGAEAALLIAARRHDVRVAVAFAPTSHVWQAPGTGGSRPVRPAWTDKGDPVPFAIDIGQKGRSSRDDFAAAIATSAGTSRIAVERIRARTLLFAGVDDQIWPADTMAEDIAARMRAAGRKVEVHTFRGAGHLLMGPGPGLARLEGPGYTIEFGGTDEGNRAARDAAWAKTLAALD